MISVRHGVQIVVHWTLHDISKTWGADSGSLDPT